MGAIENWVDGVQGISMWRYARRLHFSRSSILNPQPSTLNPQLLSAVPAWGLAEATGASLLAAARQTTPTRLQILTAHGLPAHSPVMCP